jgi:hypothetical protein
MRRPLVYVLLGDPFHSFSFLFLLPLLRSGSSGVQSYSHPVDSSIRIPLSGHVEGIVGHPSMHLSVHPSIDRSIHLYLPFYLSIHLSIYYHLPMYLSTYLIHLPPQMMQRPELNPGGVLFLGRGDRNDLIQLEAVLMAGLIIQPTTTTTSTTTTATATAGSFASSSPSSTPHPVINRVVAIFTEFPCNPLLTCPDLHQLTTLSRRYGVMLIVDDTIASFANADLLHSDGR